MQRILRSQLATVKGDLRFFIRRRIMRAMQSIRSAMKTMRRAAAFRRARVLALRSAGHTYAEIARLLGVSRQRAHQIVKAHDNGG